ncbi:unnamed protein product [Brassica napus]|uniref:(rape) hypothetical protein n=1 Tax=Brassica napus TaxID=3708 RepID=A0A816P832_BRANA|nr:unnamed protein product [Brassica napus]
MEIEKRNDALWQGKCSGTVYVCDTIGGSTRMVRNVCLEEAMRRHVNRNTPSWYCLEMPIVGSARGFPHGIIYPVEALGQLALSYGICFYDLCLGGFVLPFACELGAQQRPNRHVSGQVKANPGPIKGGLAPIYGAAGKMPDPGMVWLVQVGT